MFEPEVASAINCARSPKLMSCTVLTSPQANLTQIHITSVSHGSVVMPKFDSPKCRLEHEWAEFVGVIPIWEADGVPCKPLYELFMGSARLNQQSDVQRAYAFIGFRHSLYKGISSDSTRRTEATELGLEDRCQNAEILQGLKLAQSRWRKVVGGGT